MTDVVSAMGFGMSTVVDDVLAPGENRPERVVLDFRGKTMMPIRYAVDQLML